MIASIAAWVSAYAVSSTRLASGASADRLLEELDAGHPRHPLVGQQQGDGGAAQLGLADGVQRVGAALGAQHAEVAAVAAAQVALDRAGDRRLVVDGDQDGPCGLGRLGRSAHPSPPTVKAISSG